MARVRNAEGKYESTAARPREPADSSTVVDPTEETGEQRKPGDAELGDTFNRDRRMEGKKEDAATEEATAGEMDDSTKKEEEHFGSRRSKCLSNSRSFDPTMEEKNKAAAPEQMSVNFEFSSSLLRGEASIMSGEKRHRNSSWIEK
ncbi:unnamed protein product [Arabidopsis arenosa]|uniref:Uncharacterized protein n=1 Tax=Arabidopsis arenosa TaxID=38785 RepID=A0A8S2A385_ARAAE|nr:unnamed protein product [Arabidopsis arenosa]